MPRPRRRATGRAAATLLEEVIVRVERDKATAHLTLRWRGGALAEIDLALPRSRPATIRTDEDTIALVRRLAGPLPRCRDRRHPQSPRAHHGIWPSLRSEARRRANGSLRLSEGAESNAERAVRAALAIRLTAKEGRDARGVTRKRRYFFTSGQVESAILRTPPRRSSFSEACSNPIGRATPTEDQ